MLLYLRRCRCRSVCLDHYYSLQVNNKRMAPVNLRLQLWLICNFFILLRATGIFAIPLATPKPLSADLPQILIERTAPNSSLEELPASLWSANSTGRSNTSLAEIPYVCVPNLFGSGIRADSCVQALLNVGTDEDIRRAWGPRNTGAQFDNPLPQRWVSRMFPPFQ